MRAADARARSRTMRRRRVPRSLAVALLLVACDGAPTTPTDAGGASLDAGPPPRPSTVGPRERPARLFVPAAYDGETALPLVMLLHGNGVTAMVQDLYLGLTRRARADGFYLLLPDGTEDASGNPHWDVLGAALDDHAYLRGLLEEVVEAVPVDRGRVLVIGHSNGAFMAYRLACDSADLVTGVASLAGSQAQHACAPTEDVAILQIHGSADSTVLYDGGAIAGLEYPSAPALVDDWAMRQGCDPTPTDGASLDLTPDVDGAETRVAAYAGCRAEVTLWTMEGVEHIPAIGANFTPSVLDWLREHPR